MSYYTDQEVQVTPLKVARIAAGKRQWWVAHELGIRASDLSNMEAGRQRVNAHLRHKMAKLFNKSVDELFPTEGDK